MRCDRCHGTGTVPAIYGQLVRPCPDCGGTGITHCCEGERPDNGPPASVHPAFREHVSSPDCWCGPTQDLVEPTLWIHNQVNYPMRGPFGST